MPSLPKSTMLFDQPRLLRAFHLNINQSKRSGQEKVLYHAPEDISTMLSTGN